jgi:hypothetical protein
MPVGAAGMQSRGYLFLSFNSEALVSSPVSEEYTHDRLEIGIANTNADGSEGCGRIYLSSLEESQFWGIATLTSFKFDKRRLK